MVVFRCLPACAGTETEQHVVRDPSLNLPGRRRRTMLTPRAMSGTTRRHGGLSTATGKHLATPGCWVNWHRLGLAELPVLTRSSVTAILQTGRSSASAVGYEQIGVLVICNLAPQVQQRGLGYMGTRGNRQIGRCGPVQRGPEI